MSTPQFQPDAKPFALTLDFETSGVDVWSDRIVTAYVGVIDTEGNVLQDRGYLINPGVEIPQGAIDVHGVTNEQAREHGMEPRVAVGDILAIIQVECVNSGLPLAGMNISFDLTMLLAEARRHLSDEGAKAAEDLLRGINVLDAIVLDKHLDKYRRGSRKLIDLAKHYGVALDEDAAHDASFDAVASGRIILEIMQRFPQVSTTSSPPNITPSLLHEAQIGWRAEQQASLQAYFRSPKAGEKQDPTIVISGEWPIQSEAS